MTSGFVQVPAQSKNLDTNTVTTSEGLVHRQVVNLGDPTSPTGYVGLSGDALKVSVSNNLTITSSALPTGAATESTLSNINGKLVVGQDVEANSLSVVLASDQPAIPITGSFSLPSGAATEAKQDTGNTSLNSIDTKLPSQVLNRVPVLAQQYLTEVARGNIAGETKLELRGYNKSSSTSLEPIWAESAVTYPLPTTAQTLTLSSDSASDTAAGTGARTVLVKYVQFSDLAEVTAIFSMSGTTPVTVTTDGYGVNEMRVITAGSNNGNVGTVHVGYGTVTAGTPADLLCSIDNDANVSQQLIYTVPANKAAEIHSYGVSVSKLTYVQFRVRPSKLSPITYKEYDIPVNGNSPTPLLSVPIELTAGQQFFGYAASSGGTALVAMVMRGVLRSV